MAMERGKKPRRTKTPPKKTELPAGAEPQEASAATNAGQNASAPPEPHGTPQKPTAPHPPRQGAVSAKPSAPSRPAVEEDEDDPFMPGRGPSVPRDTPLSVKLSHQLHCRLALTAQEEGVSLEALVQELLAEGVTLRAWEIIERKNAMRAPAHQQPPSQGNYRQFGGSGYGRSGGGNRHGQGQGQGGGRGPQSGNAWMEDKAAFLEYVRNQEKRRR